jgi:hypothetical protein
MNLLWYCLAAEFEMPIVILDLAVSARKKRAPLLKGRPQSTLLEAEGG